MDSHETWTASPGSSNLQRMSMTADEAEARMRVEQLLQQLSSNSDPDLDDEKSKAAASLDKVRRSMDRMASLSQSMHEQLISSRAAPFSASLPAEATGAHNKRTSGKFRFKRCRLLSMAFDDLLSCQTLCANLSSMQEMEVRLFLARDQFQAQLMGALPPAPVAHALPPPHWPNVRGCWSSYVMSSLGRRDRMLLDLMPLQPTR